MSIPAVAADVTGSWLASVLPRWDGGEPDVVRIGADRGIGGCVLRVTGSTGRSVIVKLPLPGNASSLAALRQEIRVVARLGGRLGIATPATLHAADDGERAVLVMEDLRTLRAGDDVAGCDLADAHRCVAALGRFHARWQELWELRQLEEQGTARPNGPWIDRLLGTAGDDAATVADRVAAIAGEDGRRVVADLSGAGAELSALVGPPRTLLHHDFRLDNLFFTAGGEVVAIDWSPLSIGHGAVDIAGFIGRCLRTPASREEVAALLDTYRGEFFDGVDPVPAVVPPPALEEAVALAYRYWLAYAVVVLARVPLATGPTAVVETWIRRLVPAITAAEALRR